MIVIHRSNSSQKWVVDGHCLINQFITYDHSTYAILLLYYCCVYIIPKNCLQYSAVLLRCALLLQFQYEVLYGASNRNKRMFDPISAQLYVHG